MVRSRVPSTWVGTPRSPTRDGRRIASAWVLSVIAHAALVGTGAALVAGTLSDRAAPAIAGVAQAAPGVEPIEIDLPRMTDGSLAAAAPNLSAAELLARGGGEGEERGDGQREAVGKA